MINNLSIISVLFDYPDNYPPLFLKNAQNYFDQKDIHILRFSNEIKGSRYDKLYYYKIPKLLDYLKSNNEIQKFMMFLDATDTNFYKDSSGIIDKFLSYDCKALFCGDPYIWPKTESTNKYDVKPKTHNHCYLNSGAYMGYTDFIIEKLEYLCKNIHIKDDQGQWAYAYLNDGNNEIKIDQSQSIFFSTLESKHNITIKDGQRPIIKQSPYIVHDNGPSTPNTIKIARMI